jgi:hypothetical protein
MTVLPGVINPAHERSLNFPTPEEEADAEERRDTADNSRGLFRTVLKKR